MPNPMSGENKDDYIERCMGDDEMNSKHKDNDERLAVCNSFWEKALQNSKSFAKTYDMEVEIFAVGKWNGMEFGKEDLNMIAAAFSSLREIHQVPLKFGHNDEQQMTDGHPALGWVDDVWVEGTKLKARFTDVPEIVYEALKAKLYRNVSIELDMGVEHKGNYYTWVLSGVALLGADIPAVNTLADLQTYMGRDQLAFSQRMEFTAIRTDESKHFERSEDMSEVEELKTTVSTLKSQVAAYEKQVNALTEENMGLKTERTNLKAEFAALQRAEDQRKENEQRKALEGRLDTMVKEGQITPFMRDDFMDDYDDNDDKSAVVFAVDKLEKTIQSNPNYFGREQARIKAKQTEQESDKNPGEIVTQRTNEYMAKHGEKNFAVAKTAVLKADPDLAERYTKGEA